MKFFYFTIALNASERDGLEVLYPIPPFHDHVMNEHEALQQFTSETQGSYTFFNIFNLYTNIYVEFIIMITL